MAHTKLAHRRTHNLLLISKLLNQRDQATPFTLVIDTLEQTAKPLLREYIRRANLAKTYVVFLAFETTSQPNGVNHFVKCYNKTPAQIVQSITVVCNAYNKRILLVLDSLHTLCSLSLDPRVNLNLTAYLSSLLAPAQSASTAAQISMAAVYHTDVPLPHAQPSNSYQPRPLSLISYLATTIITIHSLRILIASDLASKRSQVAPEFGLAEEKQGALIGLKPNKLSNGAVLKPENDGIVLELEHRRKSGRGVREWYFLPNASPKQASMASQVSQPPKEIAILLDDHPQFQKAKEDSDTSDQELAGLTFELGLTDRQREERDGIVLPYFDAQKGGGLGGPGEGGRILYDMGEEDDFDEEEDEI